MKNNKTEGGSKGGKRKKEEEENKPEIEEKDRAQGSMILKAPTIQLDSLSVQKTLSITSLVSNGSAVSAINAFNNASRKCEINETQQRLSRFARKKQTSMQKCNRNWSRWRNLHSDGRTLIIPSKVIKVTKIIINQAERDK